LHILLCGSHTQNVTTVVDCLKTLQRVSPRLARACHEMNVIWRQPGLSSVGIGGGVGRYSPGLPSRTAAAASTAGSTLRTATLVQALAMLQAISAVASGRRLRGVGTRKLARAVRSSRRLPADTH